MKRPSRAKLSEVLRRKRLPDPANHAEVMKFVTRWVMKTYGIWEDDINRGYCFIWAYLVWALSKPGTVRFYSDSGHIVVKIGDRYYDSEHLDGTFDLKRLLERSSWSAPWSFSTLKMFLFWGARGWNRHPFRRMVKNLTGHVFEALADDHPKMLEKYGVDETELLNA